PGPGQGRQARGPHAAEKVADPRGVPAYNRGSRPGLRRAGCRKEVPMPSFCRHVPSLAGLLLAGVTLAAWATPARAAPGPAEIEKRIGQPGSDDRAQRDAAAKRLEEVGEPAVEPLRQAAAAKDADPDARLRAALVLRAITRGAYAELGRITGPTPGYWVNPVAFRPDGRPAVATRGW